MRRLVTIAAGISHDDRNEAVLARRRRKSPGYSRWSSAPVMISVSTPFAVSVAASEVPKNALGYCLK